MTPLHSLAVSAGSGPAESLTATIAAASRLGFLLAWSPAPSLAGVAVTQQPQGKTPSRPPKDLAELSNNSLSKQQREYQHGLEGEKEEAERLKRNNRAARLRAHEAVKKTKKWYKASAEQRLVLKQHVEDKVICARYVYFM